MARTKVRGQQSFLYGATIMVVSTAIVKILGALFKIPLARLIGASGMGYYSTAYNVYLPIYALAMAGLPIAVSRIVAEHVTNNRFKDVKRTLRVARRAFLVTGFTGFIIMLALAYPITLIIGNTGSFSGMLMIAPSLLFCCIMSSYRGYYEGLRNMYPTAVSTIIEALGKLLLGYGMAWLVITKYHGQEAEALAAAAALLGITIGTAFGALFLVVRHRGVGDDITKNQIVASPEPIGGKSTLRNLIIIAIPVVLGSLVTNIASLIDVTLVQRQLSHAVQAAPQVFHNMYGQFLFDSDGVPLKDSQIPNFLYGCYQGYAFSLYNLVPTITSVIGVSALPVLAMSWTEKNRKAIKSNIESMIRITSLLAMPAGFGLVALSPQIISLLYSAPDSVIAVKLLSILGFTAVFAGIMSPLTNMLQAIGKEKVPVRNILVGALLKIIINFVLVGIPSVNIVGAPIGTLVCYIYIAGANLFCLIKYSGVVPSLYTSILKPALAAAVCGLSAYGSIKVFSNFLSSEKIVTLIALLIAGAVYLIALTVFKAITKEDVLSLPKGEKLAVIFEKLHIIR